MSADQWFRWSKVCPKPKLPKRKFRWTHSLPNPFGSGNVSAHIPRPSIEVFASHQMKGKQPYWQGTLWRYYGRPALKRAVIAKHVTYHTFRHTFGTLLNANGENPKVVQELLRHASLKVTTDVYMQAVSPQKREAQSKLVKMVMDKGKVATQALA